MSGVVKKTEVGEALVRYLRLLQEAPNDIVLLWRCEQRVLLEETGKISICGSLHLGRAIDT